MDRRDFRTRMVGVIGLLLIGIAFYVASTYAAGEADLVRLKVGMTKDEVVQVMGKPDLQGDKKGDDLCSCFTYKNVGRYKYVNVWFDCSDKLVAIDKAAK